MVARSAAEHNVKLGRDAEDAAARLLRRQGLQILARNFRVRGGELDLVAREAGTLVFVEVRCRTRAGWAAASIDAAKRGKIRIAARAFLLRVPQPWPPCRFDVVLVEGTALEWIRGAFDADKE